MTVPKLTAWGYYLVMTDGNSIPEFTGCQCRGTLPDYGLLPAAQRECNPASPISRRWQLSEPDVRQLYQRHCELFEQEKFTFFSCPFSGPEAADATPPCSWAVAPPCYTELASALRIKREFFQYRDEVVILGVGVFSPELMRFSDFSQRVPLEPHGEFLGFDLYGFEAPDGGNISELLTGEHILGCPFRHCDENGEVPAALQLSLTPYGLYPDRESAARAASHINTHQLGEPACYVPFALVQYAMGSN